jgi:DNA-binding transcriptional ArsR family regulator
MRKKMPETQYRASRFCRVLGNPTAYQVVKYLMNKSATPTELTSEIGLSYQTICDTLRNLRNIDVVRYKTVNKNKIYFLKDEYVTAILDSIERLIKRMRIKK